MASNRSREQLQQWCRTPLKSPAGFLKCKLQYALQQVSRQRQMPIRVVVSKQSYVKAFCVSMKRPCFSTMFMLVFLSWVELCTEALTCWWESTSMMILFLDSCSCMRMTFSVPCMHQAGSHFGVAKRVGCQKLHTDTCPLMSARA